MRAAAALAAAVFAVLLLAACGSSGPPDAWTLMKKLADCHPGQVAAVPGQQFARQELTCTAGGFSNVAIATFTNSGKEAKWIAAQGSPVLKGDLWAGIDGGLYGGPQSDLQTMRHYLGGTITGG
jgi:hypothetical protein